jgi:hypothetical protein
MASSEAGKVQERIQSDRPSSCCFEIQTEVVSDTWGWANEARPERLAK